MSFLSILGSFLKVGQGTEWGYFWAAKISNIFFGVLEIPDFFFFFGGGDVDAGPEPTYEKRIRVPPPPWD